MDSFWVIVLFILFAIFSDRKDKKKPVPKRRIPDFPQRPLPDIQTTAEVEAQDAIRVQQERYQEMLRRKKKQQREQAESRVEKQQAEPMPAPQSTVTLNNLQQAVIWAEILGKPKARR